LQVTFGVLKYIAFPKLRIISEEITGTKNISKVSNVNKKKACLYFKFLENQAKQVTFIVLFLFVGVVFLFSRLNHLSRKFYACYIIIICEVDKL
jgi:hypothetical protein